MFRHKSKQININNIFINNIPKFKKYPISSTSKQTNARIRNGSYSFINVPLKTRRLCITKKYLQISSRHYQASTKHNQYEHANAKKNLRSVNSNDIEILSSFVDHRSGSVLTDSLDVEKYNRDWTTRYIGNSKLVLKPHSTNEISKIVKYCNDERIGIVPQGGNTGLVGGSVPTYSNEKNNNHGSQIILSTENLNQIHHFDAHNGILICDAGCILQDLQTYLETQQPNPHMFPLDIGSKGTCRIGGNVSTNAGGQYYYRHGSLHATVLGLEVVTPSGMILDLMNTNRKDNTGYDLKHLFIGAEGTLGIVTKISISCPRLPNARNAVFLGLDSMEDVLEVLSLAKQTLGEILSAFEMMDEGVLDLVKRHYDIPISTEHGGNFKFSLLVETQGSNTEHDMEKMEIFLEKSIEKGFVRDGILCQDGKQIQNVWNIRESCNPVIQGVGFPYKYDISVPISEFYSISTQIKQYITTTKYPHALVIVWGHLIDGNSHLNIVVPGKFEMDETFSNELEKTIYESTVQQNGSISAEHGLGQSKRQYLPMVKDKTALALMYDVKKMMDPNGIMNPGKYLPDQI